MIYRKYNFNKIIDVKSLNYDLISKYIENVYNIWKLNFINNYDHYENDYLKNQKLTYTFYLFDIFLEGYENEIKDQIKTIIKIYLQNYYNLSNKIHYFDFENEFFNKNNLSEIIEKIFNNEKIQKVYNKICNDFLDYYKDKEKQYLKELIFGPQFYY